MSEFIGSRISLISKSDIKYVGTLHEINSSTSTVALENVKSFGTEGRRGNPSEEVPPSDQIYEYIVFRGSDVKDLTIVEPPKENQPGPPQMPNDPAILGSARPPQQQQQHQPQHQQFGGPPPQPPYSPFGGYPQQQSRFAPPGGPHGFPGAPGAVPAYGMPFGGPPPQGWYPPPGQGFPQGPPGQGPPGPGQRGPFPSQQGPQGPPHGGPSPLHQQGQPPRQNQREPSSLEPVQKQSTPAQAQSALAPTPPVESKPTELSATPAPSNVETAPLPPNDTKPDTASATAPSAAQVAAKAKNSRVAVPLAKRPNQQAAPKAATAPTAVPTPAAQPQADPHQVAAAAVAAAMAKIGTAPGKQATQAGSNDAVASLANQVQQLRTDDRQRQPRGPSSGRGFSEGHRGRGGGNRRPSARAGIEVPTTDFDFESSNAKFNKQDLVKEAIATGSPVGTPTGEEAGIPTNGAAAAHDADDEAADEDVVIPSASQGQAKTYNKSTSFFDNISSELKDRMAAQDEGKRLGGSEFRSEERKKNFETFGQGSVDSGYGRGGYRGRGRGRGRGGYGAGAGRGGYGNRGRGGPRRGGEALEA